MIVIVFRARVRNGAEAELERVGQRMYELATAMPGFRSYKDFAAADGETLALVEFDTLGSVDAWREHPEHLAAQHRGRNDFFTEYHIQVCTPVREHVFP